MLQKLNIKTAQQGIAHMLLLGLIIIVGVAAFGAYRIVSSSAAVNNNDTLANLKMVNIRIGAYNAWSVTKTDAKDQVKRLQAGMEKMEDNGAEIVSLQEFSPSQTEHLKNSATWGVYRSNMGGNRGLGIAYKKDSFKVLATSDIVLPREGADLHEPVVTLQRKADKANITVIGIHLVAAYNGWKNYNKYQPIQQKAVKEKAISMKKNGHNVILAGDFNWNFSKNKGYMSPFKHKGHELTNFFVPQDQKLDNFKQVDAGIASNHKLILIDAETTAPK